MKKLLLILMVVGLCACASKKPTKDVPYKNPSARYLGN